MSGEGGERQRGENGKNGKEGRERRGERQGLGRKGGVLFFIAIALKEIN